MRLNFFSKPKSNNQRQKPQRDASSQGTVEPPPSTQHASRAVGPILGITPHILPPKLTVPAVPHPNPYRTIGILVTPSGLLLRSEVEGVYKPSHCVRIRWGLHGTIEEIPLNSASIDESNLSAPWTAVHGIVGILRLFHAAYLLVITAKSDVGKLYSDSHSIHCVRGLSAIPLVEARAREAVNSLEARQTSPQAKSSVRGDPGKTATHRTRDSTYTTLSDSGQEEEPPHIRFTQPHSISRTGTTDIASPIPIRLSLHQERTQSSDVLSVSSASVDSATPTSSRPSTPISRNVAARLNFWKRQSTRSGGSEDGALNSPDDLYSTIRFSELSMSSSKSPSSILKADNAMTQDEAQALLHNTLERTMAPNMEVEEKKSELEEKIAKEVMKEFCKGQMFFAYEFDITRSLQHKKEVMATQQKNNTLLSQLDPGNVQAQFLDEVALPLAEPQATLPLWRRVDRKFWWNEHLSTPFIEAGLHGYILPIMQGYVQMSRFGFQSSDPITTSSISGVSTLAESTSVHYAIISRRSRQRAGLRYQRRGIDGDANVANFVETETIVQIEREGIRNVFSHVQIRGSIPLFWSQPGYSLKPAPRLDRPLEGSIETMRKHFERSVKSYGTHTAVNLAELTGRESAVTSAYRDGMKKIAMTGAQYHEFDFHRECAGLRYENISKLVSQLEKEFSSQGFFWVAGEKLLSEQHGVFRINCIDCLDRTNVVMSAFARHVLSVQLEAVGLISDDTTTRKEMEFVFNDAWANNGDAISRAYAGTSALKGDYTRTGKRDFGGLLNDGMNSIMRMYTSSFSDYFSQACIDYFLGHRTTTVFSEFLLKLTSTDPREVFRLSKIRTAAIETSASMVLYSGERMLEGWTLLSPLELNTRVGNTFVEKVLILSDRAIYVVNFDYDLEKVKLYTRLALADVIKIEKGAYILSSLDEYSQNPAHNYGFVIHFKPRRNSTRFTSYAVQNQPSDFEDAPFSEEPLGISDSRLTSSLSRRPSVLSNVSSVATLTKNGQADAFVAFKALPPELSGDREGRASDGLDNFSLLHEGTAQQVVVDMLQTVQNACTGASRRPQSSDFVIQKDVVSLAEAQRLASVYSRFEYALKRLLWLGPA